MSSAQSLDEWRDAWHAEWPSYQRLFTLALDQMLHDLSDTDDESYALCCVALAAYDLRSALGEMLAPLLLAAGAET